MSGLDTLQRLRTGLANRYVVEDRIGQGGSAIVFRAFDLKHDRPVAIKVLRPEAATGFDPRRFLAEIGISARLSHPHILPLHDSGEIEGLLFFVTPFVEGDSLGERIRGAGSIELREALRYGAHVADALAHAHAQGIVHRDIKPSNILLEADHAVVCDFGIAWATWRTGRDTQSGFVVGTPQYMSPEQSLPGTTVDGRSDVYSLGCVLYEMLAGEPPYRRAPLRAIVASKAAGLPRTWREALASVPGDVRELIGRMLAVDPGKRPTAAEAARELRRAAAKAAEPRAGKWFGARPPIRLGLAAAVALALLAVPLIQTTGDAGGTPLVTNRVVVGMIENRTGEPELEALGAMAADWVTQGLQVLESIDVVPTPTALSAATFVRSNETREPLRALAEETRAAIVVSGAYYLTSDSLRFNMHVRDVGAATSLTTLEPESGPVTDVAGLIARVRERVVGSVAASLDPRLVEAIGAHVRPPTFDSYRAFMTGMQAYVRNDPQRAIPLFEQAYARDTTFLVARLFVALNYSNMRRWATADSILRLVDARRAELTPFHAAWLDYRQALHAGDRREALNAIRRANELAPGSKAAYNLGYEALENGMAAEAIQVLESIDPERGEMRGWLPYRWLLADAYHWVGDRVGERRVVEAAAAAFQDRLVPIALQARLAAAEGSFDTVTGLLRSAERLRQEERGPSLGRAYVDTGAELESHGYAGAEIVLEEAEAWYRALPSGRAADPEARWQHTRALYGLGRYEEALEGAAALVAQFPDDVDYHGLLALSAARLSDSATVAEQTRWLNQAAGRPFAFGAPQVYRARLAALNGDLESVIRLLREAFESGHHFGVWTHVTPEFLPLREERMFVELTGPKDTR